MEVFFMSDKKETDEPNLSEFDYIMAAVADYCMSQNIDKEMFWNIINHVEDGYEFLTAIEAQCHLMDIVEDHNTMRRYHGDKSKSL
jgi:hypothetical protein